MTPEPASAGGWLTIDLDAIVANWRTLEALVAPAECAAVVKADAYGLGVDRVAPALAAAGCRTFFVAHLGEGVGLRPLLPRGCTILVLNGIPPGTAAHFAADRLLPVLNSLEQVAEWRAEAGRQGRALAAALQVDTGMSRFGLAPEEVGPAIAAAGDAVALRLLMSHLACADEPEHPANELQLGRFRHVAAALPGISLSLAASSTIFLGGRYHLDMVRPGAALYGVPPNAARPNPMRPVVRLQARVAQLRDVPAGAFVGYGAAFTARRPSRIATLGVGYADGFLRAGGNRGGASLAEGGPRLPIVGRISMDSLAVDATDLPDGALREGTALDLIGPHCPLEDAARDAGTIGYELLTALGRRYHRRYLPERGEPG